MLKLHKVAGLFLVAAVVAGCSSRSLSEAEACRLASDAAIKANASAEVRVEGCRDFFSNVDEGSAQIVVTYQVDESPVAFRTRLKFTDQGWIAIH